MTLHLIFEGFFFISAFCRIFKNVYFLRRGTLLVVAPGILRKRKICL
jgi:hypothetical protein